MNQKLSPRRRALSLLLALSLILGLLPGTVLAAESGAGASAAPADHWAAGYLNQLVEWGFIRADQAQNPDRQLTRADFMSIVNRAYGYHETGETPFEDVSEYDWFYDDVGIAYTARYINGTSPTTASPNDPLNRETAATILGRNMMLQESAGELIDFSDARDISNWARGTIKSSMEHYLVNGYDDGTFRPQRTMSWGEIAAMVTRTIGTPLQDEGDYSLGGVFGNVTVTSPGVTLRDTVISGDLYVTGGVGLGGIKLENVTVLGRIIASGTGSSEGGASILMRNVTADELLVDNLQDKEVSIRADGITEIGKTTVRSSAYIEDNTPDGLGLHSISLEGDWYGEDEEAPEGFEPPKLTLAGRIEEVVNRTPNSTVHAAKGTVAKLTVDEEATGSHVIIDRGTVVKDLILDTGVDVTGEGDITRLEVNAPGCDVEMLPDQIVIRPGITAIIAGEEMDSATAEEFLLEPMILSGYPRAEDIAPTSLDAVFATNKKGRIYWAVSAVTDGSIGADELIKPPSYGNKAVRWGTIDSPRGNEEVTAKITGLTSNGTYYLSAVLEDQKGQLSPVKVISFTTPDDTVPAFNTGYPHMSKTSPKDSVVVTSTNKDCQLYYALLPENATAPTENDLKNNTVAGALGYGVMSVLKNVEEAFRVNDQLLEEKTNYVLYLWLTDADGANKSTITRLPFTTDDETPPEFTMGPEVNDIKETSVGLRFRINEDGTVYWVAVPTGYVYPKPQPGTEYDTAPLTSEYAYLQVYSGMNLGPDGKAGQVAARENADGTINITGLKPEASYDLYYLAQDAAGNHTEVRKMTINTLDTTGPKFTQHFSKHSGTDDTKDPRSDTDIYIDVSENIRYSDTNDGGGRGLKELYDDIAAGGNAARNRFAHNLHGILQLHKTQGTNTNVDLDEVPYTDNVTKKFEDDETLVIDYTQATVTTRSGGIRITFPASALRLENGAEYYFTARKATDTSNDQNPLENPEVVDFKHDAERSAAALHDLRPFTVEPATVLLYEPGGGMLGNAADDGTMAGRPLAVEADDEGRILFFRMDPDSTDSAIDTLCYDMLLWSDSKVGFDLYYRIVDKSGNPVGSDGKTYSETTPKANMLPHNGKQEDRTPDANGWIMLGTSNVYPNAGSRAAASLNKDFNNCASSTFPRLNSLDSKLGYEFVIVLQNYEGNDEYRTWTEPINFYINVAASQSSYLFDLARQMKQEPANNTKFWNDFLNTANSKSGKSIGRLTSTNTEEPDTLVLSWPLDLRLPKMRNAPTFTPGSTDVTMAVDLDVEGYITYVIAKARSNNGDPAITITRTRLATETDGTGTINVTLKGDPDASLQPPTSGQKPPAWMRGASDPASASDTVDDIPQLNNTITLPTRYAIQNRTVRPTTNEVVHTGSFDCDGLEVGSETITGLDPETDYFAYFVIESKSGGEPSHVYVYQFRTTEDMKAKIRLNPLEETGYMERFVNADTSATNGYYRMFTEDDAQYISIMNQPFWRWIGDSKNTGDANSFDKNASTVPNKYLIDKEGRTEDQNEEKTFTVLDALTTPYDKGLAAGNESDTKYFPHLTYPNGSPNYEAYNEGYSVFDIYAGSAARSQIYTFLRSGQLIQPEKVENGVTTTPANSVNTPTTATSADWHKDTLDVRINNSRYVFLTYAVKTSVGANIDQKATYSGTIYQKGRLAPPVVSDVTGSILRYNSTARRYEGRIVINWEKDTYLYRGGTKQTMNAENLLWDIDKSIADHYTPSSVSFRTFTLSFSDLREGDSLTFRPQYFCSQNTDYADERLIIQIGKNQQGVMCILVEWSLSDTDPNKKTWEVPLTIVERNYHVELEPASTTGWSGDASNLTYTTKTDGSPVTVNARIAPLGFVAREYTWVVTQGTDVVKVNETTTAQNTITILGKPGTAVISVGAYGIPEGGLEPENAERATITITVTTDTFSITPAGNTPQATWTPTTTGESQYALVLTKRPPDTANNTQAVTNPRTSFTITQEPGATAELSITPSVRPNTQQVDRYVTTSLSTDGKTVTLIGGNNTDATTQTNEVFITYTVGLVEKGTQKPLSNTVTITVRVTGSYTAAGSAAGNGYLPY